MKKVIIALLLAGTGYAVGAQEYVLYTTQTTGTYNAYSIPEPIKMRYVATYGDPSLATWQPVNGWWHATYKGADNRIDHVYYTTEPWYLVPVPGREASFKISLPVTNTYVPDEVINAAVNRYGANLYSITQLATSDNMNAYQVGLLENGTMRTVIMHHESTATASDK